MISKEVAAFLLQLLGQVNINPAQPNAAEVVAMAQAAREQLAAIVQPEQQVNGKELNADTA